MSREFFAALVKRFEKLEQELNTLDAATGDGDHGSTMLRGLRAAAAAQEGAAKAFRRAAGGASGSLFSLLIEALENVSGGDQNLGPGLAKAASRITQMGQAKAGDKTMLDALIPASENADTPAQAAAAAQKGFLATRPMAARRGRARYVEGAGIGHLDPGAMSVAEILDELTNTGGVG